MSILIENVSGTAANQTTDAINNDGGPRFVFILADDFGGATVSIECASANDEAQRFVSLSNNFFGSNSVFSTGSFPVNALLRVVVDGATASTSNLYVEVTG